MARYGDLGTQYFDDAGDPLVNGKVYFYETGTTTLKATYADVDYTIANTNPVILTAAGRQPNIFFEGVAKAILATSAGTQILVRDPVGDTAETFGNPWISSKRYSANDVVQGSDGQYYVSLINGNVNLNPVTTTGNWTFLYSVEWNAGTTYKEGSVITYQTLLYQSLQSTNLNRNPVTETTYWVIINLAYVSTVTYTVGQNVVGPDGVFYTALRTTIGDTPASSPSDWVGTSAAAAASATAALASQVASAASASTATTQASNASTSAATATTQATNAAASAATATTQASNASTSASNASTSATNAAASASTASTQASNASTSATSAASSATSATASASTATTQASNASTSASNASTSASNAATSETNAAASASTATTQATAASSSASAASTSATNASNSAAAASSSASAASTSASNAATSAAAALVSENNSTSSATASAASAAAAAAIVNISSVTTFTNPLARAVQVAITAATSASNGIQQLTNVQNNFNIGNFALQWRGSVPDWTPTANVILINKHDGTNGYILTLLTTGILRTTINGTNYDSTVATGMTDNYVAVIDVDITRSSASAAGSVVYTLNGVILGASVAIAAGAPVTVDNTSSLYVCGTSAVRSAAQWFSHRLFNRAKTVAENLSMFVNGMAAADVGASQTELSLETNFETGSLAGSGLLSGAGGTYAINSTSPISGVYDGKFVYSSGTSAIYITTTTIPVSNKTYRLSFDVKGSTSGLTIGRVQCRTNTTGAASGGSQNLTGTVAITTTTSRASFTFVPSVAIQSFRLDTLSGFAAADTFQIDNISVVCIGITSELLAQNAQTDNGQVLDSSGNKQHAKLAEAGMSTQGAISARRREVRWTNTWAGTLELQYIGGINQAILPSNAYIESIVGTVSGATPHDIIVGDGSDTDRYVTITTALAAGTNTFTVANRTTDATNLKLTVTPDTAATMSIAWVITYYRLES